MKTKLAKTIHVVTYPVHATAEFLHVRQIVRSKKTVKVSIGVVIMIVGSTMASNPVTLIPHVVWDAIAYGLHGYGSLPIIKILCKKLDLEHLED